MSPVSWLFTAVVSLFAGLIAWGRFRRVDVPRPFRWAPGLEVIIWADTEAMVAASRAITLWRDLGHDMRFASLLAEATVQIVIDPTIDERDSYDSSDKPYTMGLTQLHWALNEPGVIDTVTIRVVNGGDKLVMAHEFGHMLGYAHPIAAPTGHLLHPSNPGYDTRGLEGL